MQSSPAVCIVELEGLLKSLVVGVMFLVDYREYHVSCLNKQAFLACVSIALVLCFQSFATICLDDRYDA